MHTKIIYVQSLAQFASLLTYEDNKKPWLEKKERKKTTTTLFSYVKAGQKEVSRALVGFGTNETETLRSVEWCQCLMFREGWAEM